MAYLYEHTLLPLEFATPFDEEDDFSVRLVEGEQLHSTCKQVPSKTKAG